jgi:hypothetical protein
MCHSLNVPTNATPTRTPVPPQVERVAEDAAQSYNTMRGTPSKHTYLQERARRSHALNLFWGEAQTVQSNRVHIADISGSLESAPGGEQNNLTPTAIRGHYMLQTGSTSHIHFKS